MLRLNIPGICMRDLCSPPQYRVSSSADGMQGQKPRHLSVEYAKCGDIKVSQKPHEGQSIDMLLARKEEESANTGSYEGSMC